MLVVAEAAPVSPFREDTSESLFASMTEGGVAEIVAEGDSLGQVLVEVQGAGDGARDLHHLQCVRQAGAEVVAIWGDKDLRLVHQTPEGLRVYYAVTVSLKLVAHPVRGFRDRSPEARFAGPLRGGEKGLYGAFWSVLAGLQAGRSVRGLGAMRRALPGVPWAWARTWAETTRRTLSSSLFSTTTSLIGHTTRFCRAARVSVGRGNESAVAERQSAQSMPPRAGAK